MWDRAASVEYAGRIGVGCVIAPGVILTTRHVVEQSAGAGDEPRMVRVLSNGTDGPRARAEVAWRRGEVALLRCRPRELGQEFSPVRWGELTCTKPPVPPECSAVGLPNSGLRELGSGRDDDRTFQEPHTAPVRIDIVDNTSRTYGLQLDRRPLQHVQGTEAAAWQGMAGAAVFCSDLLMGMVTYAGGGRHGRLEAVPARQLLEDRVFCDIVEDASGMRPRLEAADLDGLFDGLPQPVAAASYLLSPRSEVVDFVGLDSEVTTLTDWCSTPRSVDVAVVHGAGGVGKTRLGVELARRLSERRPEAEYNPDGPDVSWTAGFLSEIQPQHAPPYGMFRFLTRPALIVIDHAEFRLEQVEQLLNAISEHQAHGRRIRVLLLAHSTGNWWERLQTRHGGLISGTTVPLEPDALYRHHTPAQVQELAEIDFSKRIVALHRAGVRDDWDGYQAADERAARAAAADRNGDTAIPGTVINDHRGALSVHMEALTSVLLNTPGELTDNLPASVTLLDHEMNYIRRGAGEHGFHDSDPDLLRALVALQGMAGAQDKEEADSVIETAWNFHFRDDPRPLDLGTHQKMRRTIGGLYPALGMGTSGDLGPDLLTSALIERLEADSDSAFLRQVLPSPSLSARQRRHSLALIARSISTRPRLADGAAQAIASHPLILAVPATKIAEQLREPVREVWLKSIGNAAARREHSQRADAHLGANGRRERERPRAAAPTSGGPAPRTTVPAATGTMTGTSTGTAMPPPAPAAPSAPAAMTTATGTATTTAPTPMGATATAAPPAAPAATAPHRPSWAQGGTAAPTPPAPAPAPAPAQTAPVNPAAAPGTREEHRNLHHQHPQQPLSSRTNGTQRPSPGHRVATPSPAGASDATVWEQVNTASAPRLFTMITIPLTIVVAVMLMVLDGRL